MRVAVLGGYGFVGSHVVDELTKKDDVFVSVVDDRSSCWLGADGESPRFANAAVEEVGIDDLQGMDVVVDACLRHPLERELVLYREALDRLRAGADLVIDGAIARTLRRFVVVSALDAFAERPGILGRHVLAYREALRYLHRPPHLDVVFVHLPELYGPRQLPEAGDVAAAINGAVATEVPRFGNLGYVEEAAAVVAEQALLGTHRVDVDLFVSAPFVDGSLLDATFGDAGANVAAARAAATTRPSEFYDGPLDLGLLRTSLREGIARTLEFYRRIAEDEEAGR